MHGSEYVVGDNVGLAELRFEWKISVAMVNVDRLGLWLIGIVDARADKDGDALFK